MRKTTLPVYFGLLILFVGVSHAVRPVKPYSSFFEEVKKTLDEESSESVEQASNQTVTIMETDKRVQCCRLGQIAGDKGYHCFPLYYAARIVMRNRNRVHNRKMGFHGRDKIRSYGKKTMKSFEGCVYRHASIFRHCCKIAAQEYYDKSNKRSSPRSLSERFFNLQ